jgi:hypothetical protein
MKTLKSEEVYLGYQPVDCSSAALSRRNAPAPRAPRDTGRRASGTGPASAADRARPRASCEARPCGEPLVSSVCACTLRIAVLHWCGCMLAGCAALTSTWSRANSLRENRLSSWAPGGGRGGRERILRVAVPSWRAPAARRTITADEARCTGVWQTCGDRPAARVRWRHRAEEEGAALSKSRRHAPPPPWRRADETRARAAAKSTSGGGEAAMHVHGSLANAA